MKIYLPIVLIVCLSAGFAGCAASVAEKAAPVVLVDADKALAEASESYKARGNIDKARKAVTDLSKARSMDNRNYKVEWTFAQYSYFLGSRDELSEEERAKVLKTGLAAASIAKRMEPKKPDGHFWYAAILGEQSKRSPVTVGVVSVDKIRDAMNKVIEMDAAYQGYSAYDALGQLEMGTRGLGGGSIEKAVEFYEKARSEGTENYYIQVHLAEAYLAQGRKPEAKRLLEGFLSLKPDPDFIPEHEECVADAKSLLKKKF